MKQNRSYRLLITNGFRQLFLLLFVLAGAQTHAQISIGGNVYGGTKAFVEQFTRNLRTDLQGTALKVSVIKPGLCSDTEFSNVRFKGDDAKAASVYGSPMLPTT